MTSPYYKHIYKFVEQVMEEQGLLFPCPSHPEIRLKDGDILLPDNRANLFKYAWRRYTKENPHVLKTYRLADAVGHDVMAAIKEISATIPSKCLKVVDIGGCCSGTGLEKEYYDSLRAPAEAILLEMGYVVYRDGMVVDNDGAIAFGLPPEDPSEYEDANWPDNSLEIGEICEQAAEIYRKQNPEAEEEKILDFMEVAREILWEADGLG